MKSALRLLLEKGHPTCMVVQAGVVWRENCEPKSTSGIIQGGISAEMLDLKLSKVKVLIEMSGFWTTKIRKIPIYRQKKGSEITIYSNFRAILCV